jgi:hypothetical protein
MIVTLQAASLPVKLKQGGATECCQRFVAGDCSGTNCVERIPT